jgi:cellulose synthase/poly-beta-1,6-N-acetylglucosamine synthase-like glycosyltransferase
VILIKAIYAISAILLAIYGLQSIVLSVLYLRHRRERPELPHVSEWPTVTIQLPVYNELYVVERLLAAVTQIQYPRERLQIQVLDDSTDETTHILAGEVARYGRAGIPIELLHRDHRVGYKAGALQEALAHATGEFIAIFDADFAPPADFLLRTIPHFSTDERLGMLQTRWGHTNREFSSLTRAQAIALDGHFVVEQTGRQRSGLFMSFNGTAGIWRRECIEASGGWSADTLCEDLDLSYRAQMAGWRCLFLPDVESPAEIPPQMAALKRQQARWAQGSIQCLLKLGRPVATCNRPFVTRLLGLAHLGAYAAHPMMLLLLLALLPLLLSEGGIHLPLAYLSVASFGPPMMHVLGQKTLHRDWPARLLRFPILMVMGTGLAWKNTLAISKGILRRPTAFNRTPKFQFMPDGLHPEWNRYALGLDWSNAGEIALMIYAGAAIAVAGAQGNWYIIPFLSLYLFGFGYVGLYDVWQKWSRRARQSRSAGARPQADVQRISKPGSVAHLH